MNYKTLNDHYHALYGCKVYKLSIDAGFTCPNRDDTISTGGCIFCSGDGSGTFAEKCHSSVTEQLERAKTRVENKIKTGKYIAYFQAFTNTYAHVELLRKLYYEAISPDYIVGIAIGTRPDCLPDEVIALLAEINKIKPVSVELGLQTVHKESIEYINRGYENDVYFDSVRRLQKENIEVVTHIILGLPGETKTDMLETTQQVVDAGTDGVKFHLLHVLKNTPLAVDYQNKKFKCLELEEYAEILKECIALLPENVTVHRITGDGAKKDLIAPLWSADKKKVLNYLNKYLNE